MKGKLKIPEKEISLDLDDVTTAYFWMVNKSSDVTYDYYEPIGEPIILITSNMPNDLIGNVRNLIQKYCNH